LQDPSEISGDNLNNVICEARKYFRNKKRECPFQTHYFSVNLVAPGIEPDLWISSQEL
jgi:hypothetical protein